MEFEDLLKLMVEKGSSDLFITAGVAPSMKVNGKIVPISNTPLSPEKTRDTVLALMTEKQRKEFSHAREANFALSARGIGRFRVSAFYQRNLVGMVLRRIETHIPTVDDLGLPDILKDLAMTKRGIVLLVGATGTGKSTSLAAMIGHRNQNSKGHIISIEDPIEYMHRHNGCIITQREVGLDTDSYEIAMKNALRQAPDVIMLGEIRTQETMDYALAFAETGHLVLSTLHANNANQALDRIIHFFPSNQQQQVWMALSLNLKAIVAQQLMPTKDNNSRKIIVEVMLNSPLISKHIRNGEVHLLKELMTKSRELGMQTFDQALFEAYEQGSITYLDAISHADAPNDLRLMIKLDSKNRSVDLQQAFESTAKELQIDLSDRGIRDQGLI